MFYQESGQSPRRRNGAEDSQSACDPDARTPSAWLLTTCGAAVRFYVNAWLPTLSPVDHVTYWLVISGGCFSPGGNEDLPEGGLTDRLGCAGAHKDWTCMHHRVTRRLAAFLTALAVFCCLGLGENAAATSARIQARAESESSVAKLAGIIKAAAAKSGCKDRPLGTKTACYREYADKAIRAGASTGLAGYAIYHLHKGATLQFSAVIKELDSFKQLQEAVKQDLSRIPDPVVRAQAEERISKAANTALAEIDTRLAKVNQTIKDVMAFAESVAVILESVIAVGKFVTDPAFVKTVNSVSANLRGISTTLDDINDALDQMGRGLDEMNGALVDVNSGLAQMNKGIAQANKGMATMNHGIAQANKGMAQLNRHVPDIKKGAEKLKELPGIEFDFSNLKDTWSSGSSGLDTDEQQRRMGLLLDLLPGIGDGKGIVEAITGKDTATGAELSGLDRAMGALFVLRWIKAGGKVPNADDVRDARKTVCPSISADGNSFTTGTVVLMGDGSRTPIEQIRIGDTVLATDPETGRTQAAPVTDLITGNGAKQLVTITVDTDGESGDGTADITTTANHPFWTPSPDRWTDATSLTPGTWLRTSTGSHVRVAAVKRWTAQQKVHNLTVAELHTYYVLAEGTPVLVHNAGKNKCALTIDHVGQVDQDWVTKGAHVNMKDGMEVALRPDGKGGIRGEAIRLRKGTATRKQVDAVVAVMKSDPKVRADMLRVTRSAKEVFESSAKAMKEGRNPQWRFNNDRTAELQALIEAMEKM